MATSASHQPVPGSSIGRGAKGCAPPPQVPLLPSGRRVLRRRGDRCVVASPSVSVRRPRTPATRALPVQEFDTPNAAAFSVITNLVTPFWLLMLVPNEKFQATVTEKVMRGNVSIIVCALVHLYIVGVGLTDAPFPEVAARLQFFATEAIVKFSAMGEMRQYDSFVSEEWAHVLVWDLFAGRYVYLEGRDKYKRMPIKHSIFGCFALGPLGILIHYLTTFVWEKTRPPEEETSSS